MKTINIAFVDFWEGFDPYNNFLLFSLNKNFNVQVIQNKEKKALVKYLFYSCYGKLHLQYDCIKIFYTGENLIPDFNICDYAIGFEYMEIGDRYIRYPLYLACYEEDYSMMLKKNEKYENFTDKKFCSFVVSQSNVVDPIRKLFFEKLSQYKKVDSGGCFLNNIGLPNGVKDKRAFQSNYKFSIAFENSSHRGYCTEKLLQAFAAGTVPIYWGDPEVEKYFNPKAFINCLKYDTLDDVVQEVAFLDNNAEAYSRMRLEPAIVKQEEMLENYSKNLEEWLFHICNQEYESAKRVSEFGGMGLYKQELLFTEKVMEKFASIERQESRIIKDVIIRKIWRLTR